ncbi:MAG: hypothetical protein JNN13_07220 [Planctomycetes bacterium]|nr:hypothetical protein [Planctomycetota bacterium]
MQRLTEQHPLRRGAHATRADGMCAMEMVAWLAGEPHSDEPRCACPVLAALTRACNDSMNDEARNRHLRPLVPLLVNTRRTAAVERERGMLVLDHVVRVLMPAALKRRHQHAEARCLQQMPAVVDVVSARAALRALEHFAPKHHAAIWTLQRAVEGAAPARYVAGAVHVARTAMGPETWAGMAHLIETMALAEGRTEASEIVADE